MGDQISSIISTLIALIALVFSGITLKENIVNRKATVKPLLLPGRITEFINDDNLFAFNFEYPMVDDVLGNPKLVYFGIRNIGKGPANNVKVLSFQSEENEPHIFRVGDNIIRIPEDGCIPFVIRLSRVDDSEYNFVTYTTSLSYEDIYGTKFFLSVRLWIRDNAVAVIEYKDEERAIWREFHNVVWREVERNGFFETRKLEEEIQKNRKT